ncbi:MAG: hypothetical protein A2600_02500 [Candidatus Lambdaproteobacteria bacterium RIFOXYD1_FULL_56_27]|uniref:Uncharacterized protein n=1 Tax=Candidatus Lambdaproteobacteria bacterium RIFOXYD2_FULL_56_26 TaxID=1817773 RepID=A0A1F6H2P7_9PROT|nr:MAG: hypothetical protein A2426_09540 [Candidatus Lambdaproteobacteria bacterium RIFOXYC1_FULL_56_13]OGH04649.1 MAG: hypothetical protein A2557_06565 [Candidatus Lambdaproteobacteria bacterium RIFOXYD2_FULL_56_26]OGH09113.1 MAG: hypothetical protein A2600_02500 [Candidatus Lambdaproteobacteria bacterium RIFOXYD1_FULL_56_27]
MKSRPIWVKVFLCLLLLLFQRQELFAKVDPNLLTVHPLAPQALYLNTQEAALLRRNLESQGSVQIIEQPEAARLYAQAQAKETPEEDPNRDRQPQDYNPEPAPQEYSPSWPSYSPNFNFHLNLGGGGGNNGDAAMVIFVIIGLIVVFAFVFYAATYLYRYLNYGWRAKSWSSFGVGVFGFANGKEWGGLESVRFALGFKDLGFDWGLAAEVGRINASLALEKAKPNLDIQGSFIAAGPLLVYNHTKEARFFLELLGGTSEHKEVHTVAKAMVGYRWQSEQGAYLAVSTGSLMVSLKSSLGYVRDQNPFNWLSGIEAGWAF